MTPDCAGGVHWLTVGKMTNRQGELDTAKLFNKVHTLILRLDGQREPRPLPTLEAAHDYLQKVCVCVCVCACVCVCVCVCHCVCL